MKFKYVLVAFSIFASHIAGAAEEKSDDDKAFTIVPKYFEPTSGTKNGGLGFAYKVNKSVATPVEKQELSKESFRIVTLDFKAEGSVAFNRDINPADFLKTGFELNYVYQFASAPIIGGEGSKCIPTDPSTVDECRKEAARSSAGGALSVFAGLIGSLESDQKFDKRDNTYGGHVTTVYRPAINSFANQANPLDWPFRLIRSLSGHPMGTTASPDAVPKLRFAVERVKPTNDKDRNTILGNTDSYNRANMELAMTSPVGVLQGKQVKFDWSWRYFKETGPNAAIRAAGLDRYRYSAATLKHDSGWQLTYATGKLPLDRQNDKVWELGYKIHFD